MSMQKKIILLIAFAVVLLSAVFVYASQIETGAAFFKGWNLVYGFANPNQLSGHLEPSSIRAIYAWIPTTQEYARVYPNPENSKIDKIGDGYLIKTAMWVYSDSERGENFNGLYNFEEYMAQEPLPISEIDLYKGWNFVAVVPEMEGKTIFDIQGSCNIQKAYLWQSGVQQWSFDLIQDTSAPDKFARQDIGSGIAVKVSTNCNLGGEGGITNPPAIPN